MNSILKAIVFCSIALLPSTSMAQLVDNYLSAKYMKYYATEVFQYDCDNDPATDDSIVTLPNAHNMAQAWFEIIPAYTDLMILATDAAHGSWAPWEARQGNDGIYKYMLTDGRVLKMSDGTTPYGRDGEFADFVSNAFLVMTHGSTQVASDGSGIKVHRFRTSRADPNAPPAVRTPADPVDNCAVYGNEMRLGDGPNPNKTVEIFHSGACKSMNVDIIKSWVQFWTDGLRIMTGFHGLSRFAYGGSPEDDEYVENYELFAMYVALGQTTREAWINAHGYSRGKKFSNGAEQCPMIISVGSSINAAKARTWNHRYRRDLNVIGDPEKNRSRVWISGIRGCDPEGAQPWNP